MSVKLNTRQVGDVTVIDIAGRITPGEGSGIMREAVRDQTAKGNKNINSSGIGELVAGYTSVANAGGMLELLGLSKRTQELLLITSLYTIFEVHQDKSQAVRSFA